MKKQCNEIEQGRTVGQLRELLDMLRLYKANLKTELARLNYLEYECDITGMDIEVTGMKVNNRMIELDSLDPGSNEAVYVLVKRVIEEQIELKEKRIQEIEMVLANKSFEFKKKKVVKKKVAKKKVAKKTTARKAKSASPRRRKDK